MTKAEVVRKLAKKCGVPDHESKIFTELFLKQLEQRLKTGGLMDVTNVGYFQLRKRTEIYSGLSGEKGENTVVVYKESRGGEKHIFFNIPNEVREEYFQLDGYFSLSIGRPVIPVLEGDDSDFFVPPAGNELQRLLELKAERLIAESEILTEFSEDEEQDQPEARKPAAVNHIYTPAPDENLQKEIEEESILDIDDEPTISEKGDEQEVSWDFGRSFSTEEFEETEEEYEAPEGQNMLPAEENILMQSEEATAEEESAEEESAAEETAEEEAVEEKDGTEESFDNLLITDEAAENDEDLSTSIAEAFDESSDSPGAESKEEFNDSEAEEGEIEWDFGTGGEEADGTEEEAWDNAEEDSIKNEAESGDVVGFEVEEHEEEVNEEKTEEENNYTAAAGLETKEYSEKELNFKEYLSKEEEKYKEEDDTEEYDEEAEENEIVSKQYEEDINKRKSKGGIIIALAAVIFISGGIYLFNKFYNPENSKTADKNLGEQVNPTVMERDYEVPVNYPYEKGDSAAAAGGNAAEEQQSSEEEVNNPQETGNKSNEESGLSGVPQKVKEQIYVADGIYTVQTSSWQSTSKANQQVEKWKSEGYNSYYDRVIIRGEVWYRVKVGNFKTLEEAETFLNSIR